MFVIFLYFNSCDHEVNQHLLNQNHLLQSKTLLGIFLDPTKKIVTRPSLQLQVHGCHITSLQSQQTHHPHYVHQHHDFIILFHAFSSNICHQSIISASIINVSQCPQYLLINQSLSNQSLPSHSLVQPFLIIQHSVHHMQPQSNSYIKDKN